MNFKLPPHYNSLADALVSLFGTSVSVAKSERISGGDINRAYALTLNNGTRIFMKANEKQKAEMFKAEAAGLSAIASVNKIGTPEILCTGTDDGDNSGYSFLLLKYIERGTTRSDYWETLAHSLAQMHSADTAAFFNSEAEYPLYGFFMDNNIGSTPQINTPCKSWVCFFRDMRLAPQFKKADSYFSPSDRKLNSRLLERLEDFLVEPEKPSLLHGDLWNGNVMCGPDGKAMLIDPACYIGHAEADIAMTELFGGFSSSFYEAYKEAGTLQGGYEERRDLYNLYHLLNHLNLFGRSYLDAVRSIVSEYVAGC